MNRSEIMKQAGPHMLALGIFVVLSCIYFYPQFSGKQLQQSDITQFKGMVQETMEFKEDTGEQTLWTNAMFSGMPNYQITAWPDGNKISYLENAFNLFIPRPAGYFIFAQLAFYILLLLLGINRWVAIPLAIAFAFTSNNIVLFEAGHTSKLRTLFSAPLVIGGLILAYRQKYLVGGMIFCAALAMNVFTNHVQITYYLAMCLGILVVIEFARAVRSRTLPAFAKASGILLVGSVLAVLASGYNIHATYEYSQETMRGKPTLETSENPTSSSQTDGLAWDYAMQWSNGIEDVLAVIVPRAAGGSSSEQTPDGSEWNAELRKRGIRPQEAPLYWGELPFTSGPVYFGASVLFLFVLGLSLVRNHLKWWIAGVVVLTALLSMGKHFAFLSELFFDYVPVYNKFRAPSSILTITALFIPILGALGLSEFLSRPKENLNKQLLLTYGIVGGVTLLLAVAGPAFFNFSSPGDARYQEIAGALISDRKSMFAMDALRSFVYASLMMAVLWAYWKKWIKQIWVVAACLGVVVLADLWGVDRRYIAPDDFVSDRQLESVFAPDAADQDILKDTDPHYRVHDLTTQSFQNSHRAYFHHMIGGYHAAKLQRYQDIIERYLTKGHEGVLNMLNARYFIIPDNDGNPVVRRNPQALGNAWFVEGIMNVNSSEEEIAALENLDPKAQAVVHKDFRYLVEGFDPVKNGTIELTEYAPNRLVYKTNNQGDQLAVFSEVWYGPDKGWRVNIDGAPSELLRVNYILRAVNVPSGQHEIVMEFRPARYYTLKTVAIVISLLILAGLLFIIYRAYRRSTLATTDDLIKGEGSSGARKQKGKSSPKSRNK